jgi:hypothetical protein
VSHECQERENDVAYCPPPEVRVRDVPKRKNADFTFLSTCSLFLGQRTRSNLHACRYPYRYAIVATHRQLYRTVVPVVLPGTFAAYPVIVCNQKFCQNEHNTFEP